MAARETFKIRLNYSVIMFGIHDTVLNVSTKTVTRCAA